MPPASTRPARATATRLSEVIRPAPSAAAASTDSTVPSTGRATAAYAASVAARSARASSSPRTATPRANASAIPRRICDRITPELPRAPSSAPRAIRRIARLSGLPVGSDDSGSSIASCAEVSVSTRLVPVSPSGTG